MKNLKNSIYKIHNEYIYSIKHDENLNYKNERMNFVNKFFDDFYVVFNDLNVTSILSFDEDDTKILRTKFGLYDDGVVQSLDCVAKRFNLSKQSIANRVNKFKIRLRDTVRIELARYMLNIIMEKENARKTLFFENDIAYIEQLNLSGVLLKKLKRNCHIYSLIDLLNSSEDELLSNDIFDYEVRKLTSLLHALDLRFMYELSNQELFDRQNEILGIIKSIGLSKYIEQKGTPKYELTMVSELGFDDSIIFDLELFGIVTLEQLVSLNKVQLERIFLAENRRRITNRLHSLGLYFSFEKKNDIDVDFSVETTDKSVIFVNNSDFSNFINVVPEAGRYLEHIVKLNFSTKVYLSLARAGVYNLSDLLNLRRSDLMKIKNIGSKSCEEIVSKVHSLGYCFADEILIDSGNVDSCNDLISIKDEYSKKLQRLKSVQRQIDLLQQERVKLDNELNDLKNRYGQQLGDLNGRKK